MIVKDQGRELRKIYGSYRYGRAGQTRGSAMGKYGKVHMNNTCKLVYLL